MNGYIIQYKDQYWDNENNEFSNGFNATIFDEYEDARKVIDTISENLNEGHITILERKENLVFSTNVNDIKSQIYKIVNENKISYDTIEMSFTDLSEKFKDELKNSEPYYHTSVIEKMLIGYPLDTIIIENGALPNVKLFKTILDFTENRIPLSGSYIPDLEGIMFEDLPTILKNKITYYRFRIIMIE